MTHDHEALERFFIEIAELTLNHDVIDDKAAVFANKLGDALDKVNPDWYKLLRKGS